MEPDAPYSKTPAPTAIAAPRTIDGAGSALRRAFTVPGALPLDMQALLRALDKRSDRSTG